MQAHLGADLQALPKNAAESVDSIVRQLKWQQQAASVFHYRQHQTPAAHNAPTMTTTCNEVQADKAAPSLTHTVWACARGPQHGVAITQHSMCT
jgi:hypothetical protein